MISTTAFLAMREESKKMIDALYLACSYLTDEQVEEISAKMPPQRQWVGLTDEEAHNVGERAEELIGYGHGAWDTRPLHEIVHAVLTAADEMDGIKGEA